MPSYSSIKPASTFGTDAGKVYIQAGVDSNTIASLVPTTESVDSTGELTAVGNDIGDQRVVGNNLYIWNGVGWYRIALINESPTWDSGGQPSSSYVLDADSPQDTTIITLSASDPDGLPIQYSYVTGGSMDSIATINQDSSVFTITPKTVSEVGEGVELTGSITFRASDGVNILPYVSSFTLSFVTVVENSKYTTLLATATGTSDNNNITDASTSNHTITVNGDAHAGTFSPYKNNYSTYFDGNDNYTVPDGLHLGTGDFTFEFWIWMDEDTTTTARTFISGETSGTGVGWRFAQETYGGFNGLNFGYGQYASYTVGKYVNNYWLPNGEWTHLAAQRRSGTIEIYINGVSQTLTTYNENGTFSDGANLTSTQTSRTFFSNVKGYVADLRLVTGSYVYDGDFTPSTENITAVTNTVLLTNQNQFPYLVDNSSNGYAITANGNTSIKPFSRHDNLEYSESNNGGSVYFLSNSNYLQIPGGHSEFAPGTGEFTLKFWYYPKIQSSSATFLMRLGTSTSAEGYYAIAHYSSGRIRRMQNVGGSFSSQYSANDVIKPGQWHYIEFYQNGASTGELKVNGTSVLTGINFVGNDNNLQIAFSNGSDAELYISDFQIVKGADARESSLPTAPMSSVSNTKLLIKGTDASIIDKSQSDNLKLVGNTTGSTTQVKFAGTKSMYFDGTGDYAVIDDTSILNFGTGDFTIEAWVYKTSTANHMIISNQDGGTDVNFVMFSAHGTDTRAQLRDASSQAYAYGPALVNNTWNHIAVTRSSGSVRIFVNGVSGTPVTITKNVPARKAIIGGFLFTGYEIYGSGYIQDLRVTKGLARYTANFTPPTTSLKG